MSRHNYVTDVFKDLGEEMGMGPLVLDETDRLSLVFDNVLVTFAYTAEPVELVWIYVDLGEIPLEGIKVPQRLLQLGFDCWAQNIMTIGMDDEGRNAVGYTSIPVTVLELVILKELLSRMLQTAFLIRENLAEVAFDESQDIGSADSEGPMAAYAGSWERV